MTGTPAQIMEAYRFRELTPRVVWSGPPLDRYAYGMLRDAAGKVVWTCSHRHKSRAKAQVCVLREQDRPHAVRCGADTSRRVAGQRYVYAHTSCARMTAHESGRCKRHRMGA